MQGGDKLCASAPVYSNTLKHLCHACDVAGADAGNPQVVCQRIVSHDIEDMVTQKDHEKLHSLNQYCVQNAWFNVDYGGCPYGIFSAACPVEPLHALENGLITTCLKILFEENLRNPALKAQLDGLVKTMVNLPRQHYLSSGARKDMPRLLWKDGLTTLTELTASAKTGIMFTITVLGMTKPGKDFFKSAFGNTTIYCNMMECFQMILCYWVWSNHFAQKR